MRSGHYLAWWCQCFPSSAGKPFFLMPHITVEAWSRSVPCWCGWISLFHHKHLHHSPTLTAEFLKRFPEWITFCSVLLYLITLLSCSFSASNFPFGDPIFFLATKCPNFISFHYHISLTPFVTRSLIIILIEISFYHLIFSIPLVNLYFPFFSYCVNRRSSQFVFI